MQHYLLAKELNLTTLLLDEVSARSAARLLDLTPRGTIFVLLKAQEKKEIDLDECIETLNLLISKGFRLKEEVYIETIKEARKIASKNNQNLSKILHTEIFLAIKIVCFRRLEPITKNSMPTDS